MSEPTITPSPSTTSETWTAPQVGKSEWDLLAEIRDLLAAILAALKTPRDAD